MTLMEVLLSLTIAGLAIAGIVGGYVFTVRSAEKSALALAANGQAMARLEMTRAAVWDTAAYPPVDQVASSNFPRQVVVLDLSGRANRATYATNITQISTVSVTPPLKRVHVDCIWRFAGSELVTNSVETFRAPDQ